MRGGFRWAAGAVAAMFLLPAGPAWTDEGIDLSDLFGPALAAQALDQQRAGQEVDLHLNLMDVKAQLDDNQAINTVTGSNLIGGGAFGNASGLPVAVQNSGNNVVIQNAFILNMNVQ